MVNLSNLKLKKYLDKDYLIKKYKDIEDYFLSLEEKTILYIVLVIGIFVWILISDQFNQFAQAIVVYSIFFLNMYIILKKVPLTHYQKMLINILTLFVAFRYFYWRFTETMYYNGFLDYIGAVLVLAAELYAFLISILGVFSSMYLLNRRVIPLIDEVKYEDLPSVDVFIPTYNEPVEMVIDTALAAFDMDYPKDKLNVYILDDGGSVQKRSDSNPEKAKAAKERKKAFERFCISTGGKIGYRVRERNLEAKAGNMNTAMKTTNGDLILILDCDHIPQKNFLKNTVGWFVKDKKMFLVQTPHAFYNPDPVERNLGVFLQVPSENEMFYKHIQKGHDFWEASFFCGSAAVLRRKYLEEQGGIAGQTITEDAETALGLHNRGLRSAYIDIPMVRGLQAETFSGLVLQRIRWTQGMVQIMILKNSFLQRGLAWYQKLSYFSANVFWLFGLARFVFLTAPLLYLFFGLKVYNTNSIEVLIYTIPYILVALTATHINYHKVRATFTSEIYETALTLFTLPAVIEVVMKPREPEFEVTPKGEDLSKNFVSDLSVPFVAMIILTLLGYVFGIYKLITNPEDLYVVLSTFIWNTFNLIMLILALAVTYEKREIRSHIRVPSNEDIILHVDNDNFFGKIADISMGGVSISIKEKYESKIEKYLNSHKDEFIEFLIYDVDNRPFYLKGKFLRKIRGKFIFRFIGIDEDLSLRRKLISLIYGGETRWQKIDSLKVQDKTPFQILKFLVKKGLSNINYKETIVLFVHTMIQKIPFIDKIKKRLANV